MSSRLERAEELLRAGRMREGVRELERQRKALLDAGDVDGLDQLAARAEATPDRRFAGLAYAARQNALQLRRQGRVRAERLDPRLVVVLCALAAALVILWIVAQTRV